MAVYYVTAGVMSGFMLGFIAYGFLCTKEYADEYMKAFSDGYECGLRERDDYGDR